MNQYSIDGTLDDIKDLKGRLETLLKNVTITVNNSDSRLKVVYSEGDKGEITIYPLDGGNISSITLNLNEKNYKIICQGK